MAHNSNFFAVRFMLWILHFREGKLKGSIYTPPTEAMRRPWFVALCGVVLITLAVVTAPPPFADHMKRSINHGVGWMQRILHSRSAAVSPFNNDYNLPPASRQGLPATESGDSDTLQPHYIGREHRDLFFDFFFFNNFSTNVSV